jgi:hypothetical protein
MARGFKTGGRQTGTPNKRTQELTERLGDLGCDPVEGLARIANDESASLELRARCYSDLMQYVYPRRKAIEGSLRGELDHISLSFNTDRLMSDLIAPEPADPPAQLPARNISR